MKSYYVFAFFWQICFPGMSVASTGYTVSQCHTSVLMLVNGACQMKVLVTSCHWYHTEGLQTPAAECTHLYTSEREHIPSLLVSRLLYIVAIRCTTVWPVDGEWCQILKLCTPEQCWQSQRSLRSLIRGYSSYFISTIYYSVLPIEVSPSPIQFNIEVYWEKRQMLS